MSEREGGIWTTCHYDLPQVARFPMGSGRPYPRMSLARDLGLLPKNAVAVVRNGSRPHVPITNVQCAFYMRVKKYINPAPAQGVAVSVHRSRGLPPRHRRQDNP